jgi:alcohol dehydrogenase
MSHAIESRVSAAANPTSIPYSTAAFALMRLGLVEIAEEPHNLLGRARMQVGAALAGTAIENSMLGAAHSCANPLTAHFGIIHGQAVGTMLPVVIRKNAALNEEAHRAYLALLPDDALDAWITERLLDFELETRLSALGVGEQALRKLAAESTQQWTAQFNPVRFDESQFLELFQEAL